MTAAVATRADRVTHLLRGEPLPAAPRADYEAQRSTAENRKHWTNADDLGPVSELTPEGRRTIRKRSRYEFKNNPYYAGAVRTIVSDTVGTGPRLQMLTPDAGLNRQVEDLWRVWAAAADWPLTCRVCVGVAEVAGECFGLPAVSKKIRRLGIPVDITLRLVEPDQVASPAGFALKDNEDDGVVFDEDGEPVAFRVLKEHPGDSAWLGLAAADAVTVDADRMIQWFEPTRPGQLRGVTPWVAALPIFNHLRRYAAAVLSAAEVAAMLAGVMTNEHLPVEADTYLGQFSDQAAWYDTVELVRGMLVTLPPGMKAEQFKPEQPTTTHEMFVRTKLREVGRCRNMSYGRISGDYSQYSYSSVRSEDGPYWHDRDIQRQGLEAKVFDPFLYRWLAFAKLHVPGLQKFDGAWWKLAHRWQYDAIPSSDPVKDASGDELNLTNAADTLTAILARDGATLTEVLDTRARERDEFLKRGLPLPPWLAGDTAPARDDSGRAVSPRTTADPADPEPAEGEPVASDSTATKQAAAAGDVQGTALNGAQITALDAMVARLPSGEYPEEGTRLLIEAAYPLMDKGKIDGFVKSFAAHDPPAEPAPAPTKTEEPANA